MSETTEKYLFKPKPVSIISMAEADRDKLVADTRRAALEEACKMVCGRCAKGEEVVGMPKYYWHRETNGFLEECYADKIRKLLEGGK